MTIVNWDAEESWAWREVVGARTIEKEQQLSPLSNLRLMDAWDRDAMSTKARNAKRNSSTVDEELSTRGN